MSEFPKASMRAPARTQQTRLVAVLVLLYTTALAGGGCRAPRVASKPPAPPYHPWRLTALDYPHHHGAYLGNGFMGMRIGAEGFGCHHGEPQMCLLAGAYGNEHLVQAPRWSYAAFSNGRAWFPADPSRPFETQQIPGFAPSSAPPEGALPELSEYRQTLDMKGGVIQTHYKWRERRRTLTFDISCFVSRAGNRNLAAIQWRITPGYNGEMQYFLPLGGSPTAGYEFVKASASDGCLIAVGRPEKGRLLAVAALTQIRGASPTPMPAPRRLQTGEAAEYGRLMVKRNQPVTITRWILAAMENAKGEIQPSPDKLPDLLKSTAGRGFTAALNAHKAAMQKLWQSDIVIHGSPRDQQAVRAALFYILQSAAPPGPHTPNGGDSIPPMGLSSQAWGGHIFWDADMWIFPVLNLLHPDLAASIVEYRYGTLPGARENARRSGYKGADYATESAASGLEVAPQPFTKHRHTTAGVAFAQWQYYLATGNKQYLAEKAYPILRETADYWVSRVIYNKKADRYEIHGVMCPDETAGIVNNDVYTNAIARANLRLAVKASKVLGRPYRKEWQVVADKMYLPFDAKHQRYLEHDGFNPGRRKIKQADAQLLIFPLEEPMSRQVMANTLDYYVSISSPIGPAMTASIHAVAACRLNRREQALRFFRDSYKDFVRPYFFYFSEKRTTDNYCFLTGCAGTVAAVLYGFAGLRFDEKGLHASPILPPGWTGLEVKGIHNRGRVYNLTVHSDGSYTLAAVAAKQ
jgi:trehalose/maltose hydrolase-like predicted phosphorylase